VRAHNRARADDGELLQVLVPVRTLRSEVPEELNALVSRLLEKDPANRPADAAEVAEQLAPIALAAAADGLAGRGDPTIPLREQAVAAAEDLQAPPQPAGPAAHGLFGGDNVHRLD
jgi:hypothetical protein